MHVDVGQEIGIREGDLIADKYQVTKLLGVGGMGVVVAAHHLRLDELVAIKLLLPEATADADAVRRFEREARAAVKIKSEHVARIIDVGTLESGAPFIVMEYLRGEDLADRIARTGPLLIEDAVEILLQACEAIAEAHALGIVHRDLKPANLFCVHGADGRACVKVLDFGISKLTKASARSSGLGMTKTRAMMGSPYYMSPEQMESPRTVDARTDIWSLGVVLFQLLTGEVPFTGETLPQVCVNVATRPAPSLRKLRPEVPNGLESVAMRCLEKDPNKRYPTIAALATALARFGPRRAQASLEKITRTSSHGRGEPGHASLDSSRSPDRLATGPLPSWAGTAKALDTRARNAVGWFVGASIVLTIAATLMRGDPPATAPPMAAVLVTPPSEFTFGSPVTSASATILSGAMAEPAVLGPEPATPSAPPSTARLGSSNVLARPMSETIASPPPRGAVPLSPTDPRVHALPVRAASEGEVNPYGAPTASSEHLPTAQACTLHLNSTPAADVTLDGMPLGFTPKRGISTFPGDHVVVLRWDEGTKQTVVHCAPGEVKTVAVRLEAPPTSDELPVRNPYR